MGFSLQWTAFGGKNTTALAENTIIIAGKHNSYCTAGKLNSYSGENTIL